MMPRDQQDYYDLTTEKAKLCSVGAYRQNKNAYRYDFVLEGRNVFLNVHGWKRLPDGTFNLKGQKKAFYYNDRNDTWNSKQPGHILRKFSEGWHKVQKYVASSAKSSAKSSKKKKSDIEKSRDQLRKAQAQPGGAPSLQQDRIFFSELDQQKTSKLSNAALINFTMASLQKNDQLKKHPPKDCLAAAKIAVKKIETMLLAESYDHETAMQICLRGKSAYNP